MSRWNGLTIRDGEGTFYVGAEIKEVKHKTSKPKTFHKHKNPGGWGLGWVWGGGVSSVGVGVTQHPVDWTLDSIASRIFF